MNDQELELAKASAEGTASGLLKSFHELVLKLGGPAADHIGGAFGDRMFVWRLERAARLRKRVEEILGSKAVVHPIPPRVLVPALESASLEDEDDLQDMWASLLANTASGTSTTGRAATLVEILRQLSPGDARFLNALAKHGGRESHMEIGGRNVVQGSWLDAELRGLHKKVSGESDFDNALENLARLGLFVGRLMERQGPLSNGPMTLFSFTGLGRLFVRACGSPISPPKQRNSG